MSGGIFSSIILDNESPNITYASNGTTTLAEAWAFPRSAPSSQQLYNNTESLSYQQNAYAILSFYGTDLEYWSNINSDHGPCELTLDGHGVGTINTYSPQLGIPILAYAVNNLTLGDHSFTIKVSAARPNPNGCEIDRFVVNATTPWNPTTTTTSSSSDSSGSTQTKSSPSVGVIVGCIIGGIALGCILVLAILWFRNHRRSKSKEVGQGLVPSKGDELGSITPYSMHNTAGSQYPHAMGMQSTNHTDSGNQLFTIASMPASSSATYGDPTPRYRRV